MSPSPLLTRTPVLWGQGHPRDPISPASPLERSISKSSPTPRAWELGLQRLSGAHNSLHSKVVDFPALHRPLKGEQFGTRGTGDETSPSDVHGPLTGRGLVRAEVSPAPPGRHRSAGPGGPTDPREGPQKGMSASSERNDPVTGCLFLGLHCSRNRWLAGLGPGRRERLGPVPICQGWAP